MSRKDWAVLRRVVALLFSLADLAEAACGRSRPVRWLVLLILASGESPAQDYVRRLVGAPISVQPPEMRCGRDAADTGAGACDGKVSDGGVAEARRLACVFRALASALAALAHGAVTAAAAPAMPAALLVTAIRDVIAVGRVEIRDSS